MLHLQGGDPLGTGLGGKSIYGDTFKDELDSRLLHSGRGILSMANSGAFAEHAKCSTLMPVVCWLILLVRLHCPLSAGPNTNGSQFFITYKSCSHLNYKHSVFGRVVGGFEVLSAMEKVPTDDEDRPLQEVKILSRSLLHCCSGGATLTANFRGANCLHTANMCRRHCLHKSFLRDGGGGEG